MAQPPSPAATPSRSRDAMLIGPMSPIGPIRTREKALFRRGIAFFYKKTGSKDEGFAEKSYICARIDLISCSYI